MTWTRSWRSFTALMLSAKSPASRVAPAQVRGSERIRLATYFGGAPVSYDAYDYPFTADDALDRIDAMYVDWIAGVRSLDEDALAEPCREEGHEQDTMAALILHIHREVIHHGAEISLLRDLYAWRISTPDAAERRRVS